MDNLGVVDGTWSMELWSMELWSMELWSMELWSMGIYLCKASSYLFILYQLRSWLTLLIHLRCVLMSLSSSVCARMAELI
jgi:hypothetical protein